MSRLKMELVTLLYCLLVRHDPDDAAHSGDCEHLLVPDQELAAATLARVLEAPVDDFHQDVPVLVVQLRHGALDLASLDGHHHAHRHPQVGLPGLAPLIS